MTKRTGQGSPPLCLLCLAMIGCNGLIEGAPHITRDGESDGMAASDGGDGMHKPDAASSGAADAATGPDAASLDAGDGMIAADASNPTNVPDAGEDGFCRGKRNGLVKVFILAGQSNMVGHGEITPTADQVTKNGGMGTLEYVVKNGETAPKFSHLVESNGEWRERDDVWIVDLNRAGPLTVGYGASARQIGPELEFGHAVGNFFEDQVLLIKTSWGGKSLYADFRPPSSGGTLGPYYTLMVNRVREVLADLPKFMPAYAGGGYEIAGFGWHQGWNDRISQPATDEYQANCVNLINDLRKDLCSDGHCALDMPFVLATTGMGGWAETHARALKLMEAQLAVPNDPGLLLGRARAVETRDFWRPKELAPADQGYHWNRSAESYLLIGQGMGMALREVVEASCD